MSFRKGGGLFEPLSFPGYDRKVKTHLLDLEQDSWSREIQREI